MSLSLWRVLRISRPRFWVYELGTFAFGIIAAGSYTGVFDWRVILFGLYFLFPANLLIYGINDIFDYETDKLNPKKVQYEELVRPAEQVRLWKYIGLANLPFLVPLWWLPTGAALSLTAFWLFAIFYSAKPIRAKSLSGLDSFFSAAHYVATGVMGYYLMLPEASFPWIGVLAGMLWAIAMHAYSAVPDIPADKGAGLSTIATMLGARATLVLCTLFYAVAGYLASVKLGIVPLILAGVYLLLMGTSYRKVARREPIFFLYKIFPVVNLLVGTALSIATLALFLTL